MSSGAIVVCICALLPLATMTLCCCWLEWPSGVCMACPLFEKVRVGSGPAWRPAQQGCANCVKCMARLVMFVSAHEIQHDRLLCPLGSVYVLLHQLTANYTQHPTSRVTRAWTRPREALPCQLVQAA